MCAQTLYDAVDTFYCTFTTANKSLQSLAVNKQQVSYTVKSVSVSLLCDGKDVLLKLQIPQTLQHENGWKDTGCIYFLYRVPEKRILNGTE